MKKLFGTLFAAICMVGLIGSLRADEPKGAPDAKGGPDAAVTPILDKAVKALGGEEKLSKLKIVSMKMKGTISFMGGDNPVSIQSTSEGLEKYRSEFSGEFGGMEVKGITVISGKKGWREIFGNKMDLDEDAIANEKRTIALNLIPVLILPLKEKTFKSELIAEEKIEDKPAVGIKVTGPDKKEFKLYFDKESGLPVRLVAKTTGFQGEEFTLETNYSDYKEVKDAGIKKAMKVVSKRDGEKFQNMEVTEFKLLEKADPKAFEVSE